MHPKFGRNVKPLEAKSRLEEQSFVEEGSPWFDASSPEEIQQLDNNAASGLTTEQAGLPSFPVTSAMRYIVEFCISQLLKAITLGLLVVSFNWNGSLFGVKSSDADHDVILARLEHLQTAAHYQKRLEVGAIVGVPSLDLVPMQDFALVSSGAFYIPLLTSQFDITPSSWHTWRQAADRHISNSPNLALTADPPGSCWRLPQSRGHLGIGFKTPMIITHVSIEHLSSTLDAPRDVVVWGFLEHAENLQHYRPVSTGVDDEPPHEVIEAGRRQNPHGSFIKLVQVEFSPFDQESPVQTFPVYQNILRSGFDFGLVVVEVRGNWGAPETCLYRVRVHGKDIRDES
ncbi:uncharacterized protein F5891DRAFT_1203421 [Suillus fuscotomentosus]|uniref:SUN domain-containing protein n=1 Tax=Suillus fuscotomentosus TaxID=1912939 RepID=A0AAD4HCN2_9AGAM|nr:uncharacterized protein F5891DRAFT_1203421 [Suillus fuscotomentosus]KAG1883524.1 hypothetical protein F5891DRAFT_1203421 [Suillus fuscotomentosus]